MFPPFEPERKTSNLTTDPGVLCLDFDWSKWAETTPRSFLFQRTESDIGECVAADCAANLIESSLTEFTLGRSEKVTLR